MNCDIEACRNNTRADIKHAGAVNKPSTGPTEKGPQGSRENTEQGISAQHGGGKDTPYCKTRTCMQAFQCVNNQIRHVWLYDGYSRVDVVYLK